MPPGSVYICAVIKSNRTYPNRERYDSKLSRSALLVARLASILQQSLTSVLVQRAVKKFEKLRTLAGDDVAMLVARQPEVVMLIERVEAKEHDGVVPKYTIASCAQVSLLLLPFCASLD